MFRSAGRLRRLQVIRIDAKPRGVPLQEHNFRYVDIGKCDGDVVPCVLSGHCRAQLMIGPPTTPTEVRVIKVELIGVLAHRPYRGRRSRGHAQYSQRSPPACRAANRDREFLVGVPECAAHVRDVPRYLRHHPVVGNTPKTIAWPARGARHRAPTAETRCLAPPESVSDTGRASGTGARRGVMSQRPSHWALPSRRPLRCRDGDDARPNNDEGPTHSDRSFVVRSG